MGPAGRTTRPRGDPGVRRTCQPLPVAGRCGGGGRRRRGGSRPQVLRLGEAGVGARRGACVRPCHGAQPRALLEIPARQPAVEEPAGEGVARAIAVDDRAGRDRGRHQAWGAVVGAEEVGAARPGRRDHRLGASLVQDLPHHGADPLARPGRTEEHQVRAERELPVMVRQPVPVVQIRGDGDAQRLDVVVQKTGEVHDRQMDVPGAAQRREVVLGRHPQIERVTAVVERHPTAVGGHEVDRAPGAVR